jgi:hypothetical protein
MSFITDCSDPDLEEDAKFEVTVSNLLSKYVKQSYSLIDKVLIGLEVVFFGSFRTIYKSLPLVCPNKTWNWKNDSKRIRTQEKKNRKISVKQIFDIGELKQISKSLGVNVNSFLLR